MDLAGGTHLVYRADTSEILPGNIKESMQALREVIERRVNGRDIAGVAGGLDPTVQVSKSKLRTGGEEWRLIVELPGVTDVSEAKALIGKTPVLEFKLVDPAYQNAAAGVSAGDVNLIPQDGYIATGLTGRFLDRARLDFGQGQQGGLTNEPIVVLQFNKEGSDLFAQLTRDNVGKVLAIFLDGVPIELPVIREEIPGGSAVITGNFTPEEAKAVVRNLNLGALPVPIEAVSTQSIGASLGGETMQRGVVAGAWGLALAAIFMVLWYRLPGVIAVFALVVAMVSAVVAKVVLLVQLIAILVTQLGVVVLRPVIVPDPLALVKIVGIALSTRIVFGTQVKFKKLFFNFISMNKKITFKLSLALNLVLIIVVVALGLVIRKVSNDQIDSSEIGRAHV